QGYIRANPCSGGACPWAAEKEVHVRFLSADEEARLVAVIRKDCPERELEFRLAILTGMRRGEQFDLRWDGLHLAEKVLNCEGKTGGRTVQLNPAAIATLREMRRRRSPADEYVTPE